MKTKKGMTLVELVIAMVAGTIVILPLGYLMANTFFKTDEIMRLEERMTDLRILNIYLTKALVASKQVEFENITMIGNPPNLAGDDIIVSLTNEDKHFIMWRGTDNKLYYALKDATASNYTGIVLLEGCTKLEFSVGTKASIVVIDMESTVNDLDSKFLKKYFLRNTKVY